MFRQYSIIASTPFRFLVGPDKKLFTIHAALIAHHSKPLGVLVNGPMSEAKERCALLEDDDEHTFVRFSQYAYTGDYVAADSEILLDSSEIATTHPAVNDASIHQAEDDGGEAPAPLTYDTVPVTVPLEEYLPPEPELAVVDTTWGDFHGVSVFSKDKKKKKGKIAQHNYGEEDSELEGVTPQTKKSKLWDEFKSKAYTTSGPDFQPRKNREACENYTEVFLCHARLYVFAEKNLIGPLKELSLHKLQRTLVEFTLYKERVGDIVDLLQYSYSNTGDRVGCIDDLRVLVVHYAAYVIEDLEPDPRFQSLLGEAGSFGRDLVGQMLRRLD